MERTMDACLRTLRERREEALEMGGEQRIARHHASGRLTARERIDLLVDPGTFWELGQLTLPEARPASGKGAADGVVTGFALVEGRKVAVVAIDATVLSGTTASINARKQIKLVQAAGRGGYPILTLADADGGRMPDIMGWRFGGLPLDFRQFLTPPEGYPAVPRLCAALGPCYGDSALQAAAAHYTVMTSSASIALSGPEVVATAIGEVVDHAGLGGPEVAAGAAGTAHAVVDTEEEAISRLRKVLRYFPDHAGEPAPRVDPVPPATDATELESIVPAISTQGYDMRKVLDCIVDAGTLSPWRGEQAKNLITAFARIEGTVVGMVANQPMHRAGTLDVTALEKYLSFMELCELFNMPLVQLHDVPGLMIGTQEEKRGIVRYLELVASRLSTVSVPRIGVIVRKSYGGGYFLMGGSQTAPDLLVAWPTAEMGFMAPESGVRTVHRAELADELERNGVKARDNLLEGLVDEWNHESEPWEAAAHFYLDDVIEPAETRSIICSAIEFAWGTRRRVSAVER